MQGLNDQTNKTPFEHIIRQSKQMVLLAEQDNWQAFHQLAKNRHASVVQFFKDYQSSSHVWLEQAMEEIERYDAVAQQKLAQQQKEIQSQMLGVKKAIKAVDAYNKL
ncbi:MAG: hypothetical protein COB04_01660 [Gammaproteobacteria bacterium]|nr:MAG: hypothetical protein COB04_01660 [Gammaproteobacteria bacterium]